MCDLTIASENAIFGQTGPKVGSFDAGFGSSYLARMVGQKKAREIWFLCKQYSAKEAEEMGMVNKVVPLDQLEDTCVEWAEIMMERSPLALRMIKAGLNAELDGQAGIQELAGDATMLYYTMDEAQEGGKAFLEKRKPRFEDYPQFPFHSIKITSGRYICDIFRGFLFRFLFVSSESLFCELLILGSWLAIVGVRPDADAAARSKDTCYLNIL